MEQKMALPPQQFCVRWNSYHTNLQAVFPRLLLTEQFADVTLACESRQLRCHKLVLSACSAYLERLLLQNPCKHPIVLMRDMRFSEMQALVDFMYKGEVNVTQEELPSLLKSAEALQIRGLCSSDSSGLASELAKPERDSKDYTVATEALVAHAQREATTNGAAPPSKPTPATNGPAHAHTHKKRKTDEAEVKEETVEEDGLYYGELDHDNMEYNEDDDSGKPGSSLGQPSDFPIANVQCHYDSPDERPETDHTYDTRDEPPAFIIHQPVQLQATPAPFVEVSPSPNAAGYNAVNVIHVGENNRQPQQNQTEYININKRIRRSEVVLRQAADCVSRGQTFQTVSHQFNIPISTIRFFMARKGILPQRRRGRSTVAPRPCSSPEPPYHMQHYKLPDMVALRDSEPDSNE